MIAMGLLGALLGAVIFGLVMVLVPPRRSALVQLGRFDAHHRTNPAAATLHPREAPAPDTAETKVGSWVLAQLARHGVRYPGGLRQDLALTGQRLDQLMGRKTVAGAGGLVIGLLALGFVQYGAQLALPAGTPLAVGLLAGAALFFAPDVDVRKAARKRRAEFVADLSVYLELVSLEMAGYAAAEAALPQAARHGGTWSMLLIRDTLLRARLAGQDSWDALTDLGERIGVDDLRELGSLIRNVADDGAQVRHTLSARAASMRRARLAAALGEAEQRTQSMRLAQLLIAFGFMVFVGYPAFVNIKF